jgi:phytoene synthase
MAERLDAVAIRAVADPERALMLSYVPTASRPAVTALWALDETLGDILRGGRDPMVSQLRFTWWHEALSRLDHAPSPAQPLLQALAAHVLPSGLTGAGLAAMIDGWEKLLDPDPIADDALLAYARARGAGLFDAAGRVLGSHGDPNGMAGQGWALVDLARHSSDPALAARALVLARSPLDAAVAVRWHRAGRPIGMLACLAAADARVKERALPAQGSPIRLFRMFTHAMTGR